MSGVTSCKQCGCSEIDTDPSRGDAVCTNCGTVLEESIIVSEVTFEEDGHGGASAVGQFVSSDSRGGTVVGPNGYHQGIGKESREQTLKHAKRKIQEVAQILRLNQHCVDVAFNFFKMALHKQLTKGRKNALTVAACVYMTCRIENTPHLLIDFSDVVQMDVYALGRAYLQISRALFINIPTADPCMYILRFAHKFALGDKTHEVAMTASRLVSRMKKDWIHLGRRPSGLCGAALLIAARLHNFSRTVQDIIKIVKVHETTLRKRLVEFGETPSSSLTLDEFMSVDLEEEHDPPSYKAAREKDKEAMQKMFDEEVNSEIMELQRKIDEELDRRQAKAAERERLLAAQKPEGSREAADESKFIQESTVSTITEIIDENSCSSSVTGESTLVDQKSIEQLLGPIKSDDDTKVNACDIDRILMPPPDRKSIDSERTVDLHGSSEEEDDAETFQGEEDDLTEGIDDDEINSYIMNPHEVRTKTRLWEELNKEYLEQQELRQSQKKMTTREAKAERQKQRKKNNQKKSAEIGSTYQAKTASEAIKIMLQERKISDKINYDVLKTLGSASNDLFGQVASPMAIAPSPGALKLEDDETKPIVIESGPVIPKRKRAVPEEQPIGSPTKRSKSRKIKEPILDPKPEKVQGLNPREVDMKDGEVSIAPLRPVLESASDEIVVESGPIQYAKDDEALESDEEDHHSTRKLLKQIQGDDDSDADDDYY